MAFLLRHFLLNVLYRLHYGTAMLSKICFTLLTLSFSKEFA